MKSRHTPSDTLLLTHVWDLATQCSATTCKTGLFVTAVVGGSHVMLVVMLHFLNMYMSVIFVKCEWIIHCSDIRANRCSSTATDLRLLSLTNSELANHVLISISVVVRLGDAICRTKCYVIALDTAAIDKSMSRTHTKGHMYTPHMHRVNGTQGVGCR